MLRNPWEYQLIMGSHLQKPKTEKRFQVEMEMDSNGDVAECKVGEQAWKMHIFMW